MDSAASSAATAAPGTTASAKIVVLGGLDVGRSAFLPAVSECGPLSAGALLPASGAGEDRAPRNARRESADFARLTLGRDLILYVFAASCRNRSLWDELYRGAIGAVVLVDPRRPADRRADTEYLRSTRLPCVVGVRPCGARYAAEDITAALSLDADTPVFACDPRSRGSTRLALVRVVEHAISDLTADAAR